MKRSILVSLLCGMSLALGVPNPGLSQDTQPVITPNAMIIFDTSYSMNYKSDGGYSAASKMTVDAEGYRKGIDKDYQGPGTEYFFEMGGDHPLSKLYQAKLALKKVLNGLEGINLGFSTYAQSKAERRRGQYVRDQQLWSGPTKTQCTWTRLYFKYKNTIGNHTTSVTVPLPQKGTFTFDGTFYTGMDVGSAQIYLKNHTFDVNTVPPHPPSTFKADLEYSISSKAENLELNTITYYLKSVDHYHYSPWNRTYTVYTDDADCNEVKKTFVCDSNATFPQTDGEYKTYWDSDRVDDKYPEDGSSVIPKKKWDCTGPTKTDKGSFGPVTKSYAWVTLGPTATVCSDTYGSASNWDGSKAITPGSHGYSAYSAVDKINKCYDVSDFNYSALGSATPKPDIWSYYRIDKITGNWPNWKTDPAPYYPSRDTSEQINNSPGTYDNHYFFINFPPVDDSNDGYKTKKSILDLLDLTPFQNMETLYYQTKLPVKSARYLDAGKTRPDNSITANTVGPTAVGGGPFASRALSPVAQTPIASSLRAAKQYFSDYIEKYNGGDPASKAKCRGNFVILLTDGLESCESDETQPVKAAEELYNAGVVTFVIGFGAGTGANTTKLDEIAKAGARDSNAKAFIADDLDKLIESINTIFTMIFDSVSRGNPAVSTDRVSTDKNRFYRGFFKPGWEGHLVSYKLDAEGSIGAEIWDAGTIMNSKKDRGELYSWVEEKLFPERVDFRTREKDLYELVNPLNEDIDGDSKVKKEDAQTVIKFTINPGHDSKKYKGFRSGDWFLGDLYHSTPLALGPPAFKFPDDKFPKKYSTFKESWKDRETVLYVGANDGMVHAFDKDGKEKFAVLPRNTLGKLKELRSKDHQFFIDSSPRMSDAYLQGRWRTVLLTGERGGGNYYFCLDVTDPGDPVIMWEKSDPAMGNTWSRPEIGWVRIGGQERFVAFVGGGHSVADDVGNTFYVLDMEDGTILRKFAVGDKTNKVAAGATAFDSDSDGRVDGVYFGDTSGVLWKIKIDMEEDVSKWKLVKLFDPKTNHPIFYPPVVTKNNQKKILVYFGQGDELNIYDDTIANSFFEIWDNEDTGELSWERKLEKGEKVLASAAFANNIIYFTTFKYTGVVDNCGAGIGRIYGVTGTRDGITGNQAALYLNPLTGEPFKDPKEYITITDYFPKLKGIPSAPVVVMGQKYIYYYFSTSGSVSGGVGRNLPAGQARLKYWREVF